MDEGGAALIIAICVIMIMMIIGGTVMSMSLNSDKTVALDRHITMAQNVAEAGVDDVIAVTVANYNSIYGSGHYPTMATPFYEGANHGQQQLKDKDGNVLGSYEVYTQADPDRPGNVLITSQGKDTTANGPGRTVRVSVKYTPDIFDYVLLPGSPTNQVTATFTAQNSSYGDHHDDGYHDGDSQETANIAMVGNIGANGSIAITSTQSGEHWGEHEGDDDDDDDEDHEHDHSYYESPGTVSFLSRDGHNDSASYTNYFTGQLPLGNQPVRGNSVNFPTVTLTGAPTVKTVVLPSSGSSYTGGWSRSSGTKVWKITASNFQNSYRNYNAVKLSAQGTDYTIEIDGSCGSPDITPSVWLEYGNGGNSNISNLNLVGPGIRLMPVNGIAIMADRGAISFTSEAFVGRLGSGALIYSSGTHGATSLTVTGNLAMYGAIAVNGPTTFTAEGTGIVRHDHERSDEHDNGHSTGNCSGSYSEDHEYDHWHSDQHHRTYVTNIQIDYDAAFLDNSHHYKPDNFFQWTGSGSVQAIKENYDVV